MVIVAVIIIAGNNYNYRQMRINAERVNKKYLEITFAQSSVMYADYFDCFCLVLS